MSGEYDPHGRSLPLDAQQRIDAACVAFESAWRAGERPQIEQFLSVSSPEDRRPLLQKLLAVELEYRRKHGETLSVDEYRTRFSDDAGVVAAVFSQVERETTDGPGEVQVRTTSFLAAPRRQTAGYAIGQKIGRYTIQRELGHGGFAAVYLARDEKLLRSVAVKAPHSEYFGSAGQVEDVLEEARAAAGLKHPGIVAVHDVGKTEDGVLFIVMDHIDGCSLKQRIEEGPLPFAETATIVAEVAEAADFAHRRGFVHRDLKPANILLDRNGRAHIADFGLALHETRQRERAGERSGTLAYMSPEQIRGEAHHLDGRSDIWSIGVVLYELLVSRRPFTGDTSEELAEEILERLAKPLRQIDAQVPAKLEQICLKCLAKDPGQRYATAADVARDLLHYGRPRRRLWGAAAVLVAAIAILGYVISQLDRWQPAGPAAPPPRADLPREETESNLPPQPVPIPPHVEQLSAAEVLKVAYTGVPPALSADGDRAQLQLEILARRQGQNGFAPLADGGTLRSERDDYFLAVNPLSEGFLYVFQVDSAGKTTWLFPKNKASDFSSGMNPVGNDTVVQIPGKQSNRVLFLDRTPGIEHIYAVLSGARWPELERALARPADSPGRPDSDLAAGGSPGETGRQPNGLRVRGVGGTRVKSGPIEKSFLVERPDNDRPWSLELHAETVQATGPLLVIERWFHHDP